MKAGVMKMSACNALRSYLFLVSSTFIPKHHKDVKWYLLPPLAVLGGHLCQFPDHFRTRSLPPVSISVNTSYVLLDVENHHPLTKRKHSCAGRTLLKCVTNPSRPEIMWGACTQHFSEAHRSLMCDTNGDKTNHTHKVCMVVIWTWQQPQN